MKRSPLPRYTPLRAKRNKPQVRIGKVTGKIRLSGQALDQLRDRVYRRDQGRCQWPLCGVWMPKYGSVFNRAHMAHIRSRGASGSDTDSNVRILCFEHHILHEHGGRA